MPLALHYGGLGGAEPPKSLFASKTASSSPSAAAGAWPGADDTAAPLPLAPPPSIGLLSAGPMASPNRMMFPRSGSPHLNLVRGSSTDTNTRPGPLFRNSIAPSLPQTQPPKHQFAVDKEASTRWNRTSQQHTYRGDDPALPSDPSGSQSLSYSGVTITSTGALDFTGSGAAGGIFDTNATVPPHGQDIESDVEDGQQLHHPFDPNSASNAYANGLNEDIPSQFYPISGEPGAAGDPGADGPAAPSSDASQGPTTVTVPFAAPKPFPDAEAPVIPEEYMKTLYDGKSKNFGAGGNSHYNQKFDWTGHPGSGIVAALLARRGIRGGVGGSNNQYFDRLVDYHMSPLFLDSLQLLMRGAYFIRYKRKNTPPKERFFRLVMIEETFNGDLPLEAGDMGGPVSHAAAGRSFLMPYLMWLVHQDGKQIVDKVPISHLVGVVAGANPRPSTTSRTSTNAKFDTAGNMLPESIPDTVPNTSGFSRFLVGRGCILGCFSGAHRPVLNCRNCFSLWFWDPSTRRPRSLELLNINNNITSIWFNTFRALLSVNSCQIGGGHRDLAQALAEAMQAENTQS